MAAHQALPCLGFSRQECWSGLSFPSPMHESEKWKWSHSVMSDSLQPHRGQPTRLLRPWDFPGKSTGVGCQLPFLANCLHIGFKVVTSYPTEEFLSFRNIGPFMRRLYVLSRSVMSNFCHPMDCSPPGSSVHADAPGKNTRVGCHALLQVIFSNQELNPGIPHGWMASPTRWEWVWVNSGSLWWTGRPGVLRFMGSQRIRHDWVTELNWTDPALQADSLSSEPPGKPFEKLGDDINKYQANLYIIKQQSVWSRGFEKHQRNLEWIFFFSFPFSCLSDPSLLLRCPIDKIFLLRSLVILREIYVK